MQHMSNACLEYIDNEIKALWGAATVQQQLLLRG